MKNALDFTFGYQTASSSHAQQLAAAQTAGDMGAFDQLFGSSGFAGSVGSSVGDLYGSRLPHGLSGDPTAALLGVGAGHHYRGNGVTSAVTSSHPFAPSSSSAASTSSYDVMNVSNGVYDVTTPSSRQPKSASSANNWITSSSQCQQSQQSVQQQQQQQQQRQQQQSNGIGNASNGDAVSRSNGSFSNPISSTAVQYYPWMGVVGEPS